MGQVLEFSARGHHNAHAAHQTGTGPRAGSGDAGKPVVMVDTRNAFEVDVGTFNNTVGYRITRFTGFPDRIAAHKAPFV